MCYFRMARTCNDAASMGIQPSVIRRLPNAERGCKLVLFGSKYQFTVRVRVSRSCATISIFAEPLDGHPLHCRIPVLEDEDSDRTWSSGASRDARVRGGRLLRFVLGRRAAAGRRLIAMAAREDRKLSGTGHTVEVKSVSMTPESWRLLDELRGNSVVA
jgi:hypothetical protein